MSRRTAFNPRAGFTLVELLVVIAIIGVLVALLLPAVQAAREAARRSSCSNNLKQIGLGLHNYHDTHLRFPPESIWAQPVGASSPPNWDPRNYSWIALMLPYIEQGPLHSQINFSLPLWNQNTSAGQPIRAQKIPILLCPSDRTLGDDATAYRGMSWTNYVGAEGYDWWNRRADPFGGVFTFQSAISLKDITDGTSNTIAVGEATSFGFKNGPHHTGGTGINRVGAGEAIYHPALVSPPFSDSQGTSNSTTGGYPDPDTPGHHPSWNWFLPGQPGGVYKPTYLACWGINSDWPGPGSFHPGGAQFVFADGAVHFIPETIQFATFDTAGNITNWNDQLGVWMKMNTQAGEIPVELPF